MTQSPSAESPKTSKRKGGCPAPRRLHQLPPRVESNHTALTAGTRSVSTLTPSQLARKRANDREAQRAIRARTKEHIDRLEKEVDELKNLRNRDETVQELVRRNKALERELMSLRESLGMHGGRPYPLQGTTALPLLGYPLSSRYPTEYLTEPAAYEDGVSAATGSGVSSRASSMGQSAAAEYSSAAGFGTSYLPTPEPCEAWPTVAQPVSSTSVTSAVSSPSSSTGHPDDYIPAYIPTSVPTTMMESASISQSSLPCLDGNRTEYSDVDGGKRLVMASERMARVYRWADPMQPESSYPQSHVSHRPTYAQQQAWSMYPATTTYYPQSPAI